MLVPATKGVFSIMTHTWMHWVKTLPVNAVVVGKQCNYRAFIDICIEVQVYTAVKECLYLLPLFVP